MERQTVHFASSAVAVEHEGERSAQIVDFVLRHAPRDGDAPPHLTFRLIDAASRLIGFVLDSGQAEDEEFLRQFKDEIDGKKLLLMTDEERYFQFLRDVAREIAQQLKKRAVARKR